MILIVMGVAGSGKTTAGRLLAQRLGASFLEGDEFHPPANIAKMSQGIALTDADRRPWLDRLRSVLANYATTGRDVVLACSALKEAYRTFLAANMDVSWIYLKADPALLHRRLEHRSGHYFPSQLLDSQLDALQEPRKAIIVDASLPLEQIVERILQALGVPPD